MKAVEKEGTLQNFTQSTWAGNLNFAGDMKYRKFFLSPQATKAWKSESKRYKKAIGTQVVQGTNDISALKEFKRRRFDACKEDDMWALGITLYLLMFNELPFDTPNLTKKVMAGYLSKLPSDGEVEGSAFSADCLSFLRGLLNTNNKKRLTSEEALKHPWSVRGCLAWI